FLTTSTASGEVCSWVRSNRRVASVYFFPCFAMTAPSCRAPARRRGAVDPPGEVVPVGLRSGGSPDRGSDDVDAHRPGGARDLETGGLEIVGVEVGHLHLGDLGHLGVG